MDLLVTTAIALDALAVAVATLRGQNRGKFNRLHFVSHQFRLIVPFAGKNDKPDIHARLLNSQIPLVVPHVVAVRIENTGAAAVTESDFASPLVIDFGEHTWFAHGSIISTPEDVFPGVGHPIRLKNGNLCIDPLLLNPRDQLSILALVDGFPENVRVTARVAGWPQRLEACAHLRI